MKKWWIDEHSNVCMYTYIRTYKHTHTHSLQYIHTHMCSQSIVHTYVCIHTQPHYLQHIHTSSQLTVQTSRAMYKQTSHTKYKPGYTKGISTGYKYSSIWSPLPTTITRTLEVPIMGISGTISLIRDISVTSDGAHQGYYQHSLQALWNVLIHHTLEENAGSSR